MQEPTHVFYILKCKTHDVLRCENKQWQQHNCSYNPANVIGHQKFISSLALCTLTLTQMPRISQYACSQAHQSGWPGICCGKQRNKTKHCFFALYLKVGDNFLWRTQAVAIQLVFFVVVSQKGYAVAYPDTKTM